MKHLSQPYHELAAACQSNQSEEARNIVIKNQFIFQKDNNIGLTKQVKFFSNRFLKYQILNFDIQCMKFYQYLFRF